MLTALTVAAAVLAAEPEPRQVELTAEQLFHDGAAKRTTAEGSAQLRTAGSALSADRIVYDEGRALATASGSVALRLVTRGLLAVTADSAAILFEDGEVKEVFIYDGLAVRKKNTTREALLAARTPQELDAAGQVSMTLTGSHLARAGDDWIADDIVFVPCDCDFSDPFWGIHAARARVSFDDERVSLLSPTVRVKGVPIFWLPWISLPLTNRQTGLLVPKPTFSGLSGFGFEEPVFITLGQSADLTITPGYFFGNPDASLEVGAISAAAQGEPALAADLLRRASASPYGFAGPRLLTEFRYTPNAQTSGRITLGLIYDLRAERDPVNPGLKLLRHRGLRGEGSLAHHQTMFGNWHLDVGGSLLSDGNYLRDVTADVLAREAFYLRSTGAFFRRGEHTWLGLDVLLRQDLSWGYSIFRDDDTSKNPGIPARGPNPFHRLPALTFAVPERRLWGPLTWAVTAEFVRLSPLSGSSGDEGPAADEGRATAAIDGQTVKLKPECVQTRLYWPVGRPAGVCPEGLPEEKPKENPEQNPKDRGYVDERALEGDRTWQPGERQARDRFDLFPRLRLAGRLGDVLSLGALAAWRQDVWVGEADGLVRWRGYPLLSGRADTELARSFATSGGALRHVLGAGVELKGAPFVLGDAPVAYDEVDAAWPDRSGRLQGAAELRSRLLSKQGAQVRELFRLELGQGAELLGPDGPRLAESYGRLGVRARLFSTDLAVRVDGPRGRVTRISALAGLDDGQGRALYAGWENVLDDGTDRTRQPIDLLFGPAAGLGNARAQVLTFGGRFRVEGFTARYEALMFDRTYVIPGPAGPMLPTAPAAVAEYKALTFVQHSLGLGYGPRCECWRVEVYATQRSADAPGRLGPPRYLVPDFGATVTLSGFGAFGTSG